MRVPPAKGSKGVHPLSTEDIALTIESIIRLPAHVNVNALEVMPVQLAFSPFAVNRAS